MLSLSISRFFSLSFSLDSAVVLKILSEGLNHVLRQFSHSLFYLIMHGTDNLIIIFVDLELKPQEKTKKKYFSLLQFVTFLSLFKGL